MRKQKKEQLPRSDERKAALRGKPHRTPTVKQKEENGKLYVTVQLERSGWQRVLGADKTRERTFGLDAYGRRVYECCDGKQTVQAIINQFAKRTHVSVTEAEMAVTKFVRTLMSKGLLVIEMPDKL
ncbi:MAG: PqqD family protein [Verrucomicrobia bacterium]|jgi:hypothetical protein|nr:PqqD family protein [Verrucomicrobiota bacterium]MBT7064886.1 PqqD family protein [Verrucomicrobiota bacterium]MBT7702328.1 PqqD family protein [Verrucomicrobiota bacterium]